MAVPVGFTHESMSETSPVLAPKFLQRPEVVVTVHDLTASNFLMRMAARTPSADRLPSFRRAIWHVPGRSGRQGPLHEPSFIGAYQVLWRHHPALRGLHTQKSTPVVCCHFATELVLVAPLMFRYTRLLNTTSGTAPWGLIAMNGGNPRCSLLSSSFSRSRGVVIRTDRNRFWWLDAAHRHHCSVVLCRNAASRSVAVGSSLLTLAVVLRWAVR